MNIVKLRGHIFSSLLTCVLGLLILLTAILPMSAAAREQKTVRVGYVSVANYEEGGENEYKRGMGYEYLQRISYLTGWKYQYVYGSFRECLEMLKHGEIDLMGNVSYTEERARYIDYSAAKQGKDIYLLYTNNDRHDLIDGDLTKLNGCSIGVTSGSYQQNLLKQWLVQRNISAKIVAYDGYADMTKALHSRAVDVIAATEFSLDYDFISIARFGSSDYYFGVSKQRSDLRRELDVAMKELQATELDYNAYLSSLYYTAPSSALLLNAEEKAWLQQHNNTLRLGYAANALPYCGEKNGEMQGALRVIMDNIRSKLGVEVVTKPYADLWKMKDALNSGEVDMVGPIYGDLYLAEQENCIISEKFLQATPVVLYKGGNVQKSLQRIAVTNSSIFSERMIRFMFPNAEIFPYVSQLDCVEAIVRGYADSMVVPSTRMNIIRMSPLFRELSFAELPQRVDLCLITNKENVRPITIFNKGIKLSADLQNGVVMAQHSLPSEALSWTDFVEMHARTFVLLATAIILVLGYLAYRLNKNGKRLEQALAEAQSANIAKTTFLNNMSHDIRTPMNAIVGFTNIALRNQPKPEVESCLRKIESSSKHLLTLINDVLDISRIDSGSVRFNPKPVDITQVEDTIIDITKGFIGSRRLELRQERQRPQHPFVLADDVRLREALINILSNAVKFTDDGGVITFASSYETGNDAEHIRARYAISDTGVGMSEEFLPKLFDEFAQEENGARTQYKGTGLGMPICKRYVEMMHGTISVSSTKGKGSNFVIELPLQLTDAADIVPGAEQTANHSCALAGIRVLLVEDNDMNAEIAIFQLEGCGMKVTRAADGEEAVAIFAKQPPESFDIVLMDIMMPKMNGYETTRAIRTMDDRPDGRRLPIVALSANAFVEDVQKSLDAGMCAHLSKPMDMKEVKKTISGLLHR